MCRGGLPMLLWVPNGSELREEEGVNGDDHQWFYELNYKLVVWK